MGPRRLHKPGVWVQTAPHSILSIFTGDPMRNALLLTLALGLPSLTHADGAIAVAMPNFPDFSQSQNEEMLTALVTAVVVGMNCPGFEITDGEWSLLNGAADIIANNELGLSTETYDTSYFSPAFALLDKPGTCAAEGPQVQPLIEFLIGLGGSREPM